jgi:predicted DNA-binding protein (MmcQ/YjbR family)
MTKKQAKVDAALLELRAFGLAYPGAHLKSPWPDHCDLAVNDKTFAYMSPVGEPFGISCKLPSSSAVALMLPNTSPTAYGLGKSGWVTAECAPGEVPEVALFKAWIDESYRAQAPKKLIAQIAVPKVAAAAAAGTPKVAASAATRASKATASAAKPARAASKKRTHSRDKNIGKKAAKRASKR